MATDGHRCAVDRADPDIDADNFKAVGEELQQWTARVTVHRAAVVEQEPLRHDLPHPAAGIQRHHESAILSVATSHDGRIGIGQRIGVRQCRVARRQRGRELQECPIRVQCVVRPVVIISCPELIALHQRVDLVVAMHEPQERMQRLRLHRMACCLSEQTMRRRERLIGRDGHRRAFAVVAVKSAPTADQG